MSIWGKIIGGAAGFALGGPIGALIGVLGGHAVDKMSGGGATATLGRDPEAKQVAFTIAVIALGAKMAKVDGVVSRSEIDAFKQVFRVPPAEMKNVARVFDQAKKDALGFDLYARQVASLFADQPAMLEELLNALFHIARADGVYHPAEREFLRQVAQIFGFSDTDFARIEAENQAEAEPDKSDPYAILGVGRDATVEEIKKAYRKLIHENHPDKLVAEGLPQEFIDLANERMATINAAYDRIQKERGFS